MTCRHTFDHMRQMSMSKLFDRRNRDAWMAHTDGRDLTERAYDAAEKILTDHTPPPLPDGAAKEMAAIIAEYEARLKAGGA